MESPFAVQHREVAMRGVQRVCGNRTPTWEGVDAKVPITAVDSAAGRPILAMWLDADNEVMYSAQVDLDSLCQKVNVADGTVVLRIFDIETQFIRAAVHLASHMYDVVSVITTGGTRVVMLCKADTAPVVTDLTLPDNSAPESLPPELAPLLPVEWEGTVASL